MSAPLISIIIPVYNRVSIFRQSLASALAQTYPNTEIIVIDDGSNSPIVLPKNVSEKVQLFRQKNAGAPAARNAGFAKSRGEYVIFWDADVIAEPKCLRALYEGLQRNPGASYAYCDFKFGHKKMTAGEFSPQELREGNYITTTSLIRRADFPGFDVTLKRFQDWDLWLTMLAQKKVGTYVPECLFRVITGGTMSSWLPAFAYNKPWRWLPIIHGRVSRYEMAEDRIRTKHGLA